MYLTAPSWLEHFSTALFSCMCVWRDFALMTDLLLEITSQGIRSHAFSQLGVKYGNDAQCSKLTEVFYHQQKSQIERLLTRC